MIETMVTENAHIFNWLKIKITDIQIYCSEQTVIVN